MNRHRPPDFPRGSSRGFHRGFPRGFAVLYTLALMGIVGVVVMSAAALLSRELSRTGLDIQQAQLRTLLRYGADQALQFARDTSPSAPRPTQLTLPPELSNDGFALNLLWSPSAEGSTITITASTGNHRLRQTLVVSPAGEPVSATLLPATRPVTAKAPRP